MRALSILNKKGVSMIVAYVVLISIAISLSVIVYSWLRWYVAPGEEITCEEGTRLIIEDYICQDNMLNITIRNKGRFTVDGFIIRINERAGSEIGIKTIEAKGEMLKPGERFEGNYSYSDIGIDTIQLIEVQPFLENGKKVFCEQVSSQKTPEC
ncbi:MAG: hypothetical protein ACP5D2_00610 [Candidatus Nanoarchaeia archaeon]